MNPKTILLTGATDGIGLAAAKQLGPMGHHLLLHGRNSAKLDATVEAVASLPGAGPVEEYVADMADFGQVGFMADAIAEEHANLDVLINNAGVFKTGQAITRDGLDVRFAVNTLAPWMLTQRLLPLMNSSGRVVNLSSAAQAPVNLQALDGTIQLSDDFAAYAQSKLALTMWSRALGQSLQDSGPMVVAVNPGSLLASKMVQEGFGVAGNDISIGADILCRAALSEEFAAASGLYYDNDSKQFAPPQADALNEEKCRAVIETMDAVLAELTV